MRTAVNLLPDYSFKPTKQKAEQQCTQQRVAARFGIRLVDRRSSGRAGGSKTEENIVCVGSILPTGETIHARAI
jgi:hypothetical protein